MTDMNPIAQMIADGFNPSEQQADLFNWILTGEGSCVLEAVAGSGKTTTLIKALILMQGTVFFGAYNKNIAIEIQNRAPKRDNLTISTMHAAGLRAWRRAARPNLIIDSNKCRDIFRAACDKYPEYRQYEGSVLQLVSYAKQAAVGVIKSADDRSVWLDLIDHFDVETLDNETMLIKLARTLLAKSVEKDFEIVDFDDMIYAPLVHHVKIFQYDWVLIDEAQDTNASRRALALAMLKRGGRLIAVGDRHQAIYGFTGADANALDLIGEAVTAKKLPLTVTYRCPKRVVEVAQQYVNHIQAHDSAPDGKVASISHADFMKEVSVGDAVLCRFNAPIITIAYALIAAGKPARVEGREIGEGLKSLAKRWKAKTFDTLLARLDTYCEREVAKYRVKEQESRAAAIEDRVHCLKVIIQRVLESDPQTTNPVQRVCVEVDAIFGNGNDDKKPTIVLSTIHKSKGREWHRVFWLQAGQSKWARKQWELDQEVNLCYVAATRAQSELYLTDMPPSK
jgi:superfamily I DNA/RNA helicase